MNTQQQTDHQNWKLDQNQPLPASLENVLIEDCEEYIFTHKKEIEKIDYILACFKKLDDRTIEFEGEIIDKYFLLGCKNIADMEYMSSHIILTLLSKGVMPFLDVETEEYKRSVLDGKDLQKAYPNLSGGVVRELMAKLAPKTLDHLLYREFAEALRVGKTFDEAYKIINLTYLRNV